MCYIPFICNAYLNYAMKGAFNETHSNLKKCPFMVFDGNVIDFSNVIREEFRTEKETFLFTVYHTYQKESFRILKCFKIITLDYTSVDYLSVDFKVPVVYSAISWKQTLKSIISYLLQSL